MSGIRLVAPFLPLPAESELHKQTQNFDWMDAIRMLQHSCARSMPGVPFHVITDAAAEFPASFPFLRYATTQRRLMLWTLEACAAYLESDDFDRDTVMLDCDQLVYRDLSPWFSGAFDLGLLVRTGGKHDRIGAQPLLNGVQFWAHEGKPRLAAFYRKALAYAELMPEPSLVWGADTEAVCALIQPISLGIAKRSGVRVRMTESETVLEACSEVHMAWMAKGYPLRPSRAVVDFRWLRKKFMRPFYDATYGAKVPA